jgi:uncharacterized protein (DUF433 family)
MIRHGKPAIRGKSLPVARIVCGLASGMFVEEIILEYEITREYVYAAWS